MRSVETARAGTPHRLIESIRIACVTPAAAAILIAAAGCDSILDIQPPDQLPIDDPITDALSARAALAGAYNALQSLSYYGGDFLFLNDVSADNAVHTGTLTSLLAADRNQLRADNGTIAGVWATLYDGINRANLIIERLPEVNDPALGDDERDQILGEAYFLRALHHHNLVKLWGDVPLITIAPADVDDASRVTRTAAAEVYDQIIADLQQAEQLMTDEEQTRQASVGAAEALLARVYLGREDWVNAEAKAAEALGRDYSLASAYSDLFEPDGADTPEDVFRVIFTPQDFSNVAWYYLGRGSGGRAELGLDARLTSAYEPGDARRDWSLGGTEEGAPATKFSDAAGAEHIHVIRLAEVMLIRAEALARLDRLAEAVATYNPVRLRAGLEPHELGVSVTTQSDVIEAILRERRVELAFEGDRWADLVRLGRAEAVMGIPATQTRYPIPQSEIDVAPGLTQNPGY